MTRITLIALAAAIATGCSRGPDAAANHDVSNPRDPVGNVESPPPSGNDDAVQNAGEEAAAMPDGRANQGGTGPAAADGHTLSATTGGSIPPAVAEPTNEPNERATTTLKRRAKRR